MQYNKRHIKKRHEQAMIATFLRYYNRINRANYQIVATPNPPDAIVSDGIGYKWIEHCDIYRCPAEAEADYDSSCLQSRQNVFPESQIVNALIKNIQGKLDKPSYSEAFAKHGLGILLVVIRDSLFSDSTLEEMVEVLNDLRETFESKGCFEAIYLTWNSKGVFFPIWPKINAVELQSCIDSSEAFQKERGKCFDELVQEDARML
jgi:hypothetical protein